MLIIKDGSGTGFSAGVDSQNRLRVDSVVRPLDQRNNEVFQKVFSLSFDAVDPVGADDYFFYLQNTGTKNIHVTDVRIRSTVAGNVEVRAVSGTPSYTSDTDITPINRTIGSTNTLDATVKTDTNTTGLTNDGVLFYIPIPVADTQYHLATTSNIIIPPGQSVALLWDAILGMLSGTISVYEDQGLQ